MRGTEIIRKNLRINPRASTQSGDKDIVAPLQ